MSAKTANPKICRICEDQSDGYHFGIHTCRACAAFFRRSISMKKSYRCHKGDEKCDVNKSVRCMCRFCRFKKCIRMGMKITSVQHQRDAIGRRGGSSDRSIDDRVYETDRVEIPEKYKSLFSSDSGLSSASPTDHESMMPTLYRVRRCYHQFLEVRARAHPVFGLPRPGHFSTTIEAWVAEVPHLTAFVERAFDEYKELSDSQKWLLVRTFFVTFIVSEGSYRSVLLYDQNDHWLLPTNEYIDMDNPAHYFYDHTSKYSLTQVGDMMRPSMHLLIRNLLIPFREIGITDLEFAGFLSVLLWSRGYEGQNENCDRMASQIRDKITIELSYYYKEVLKIPCYVVRLSRLLMLVPSVQRMTVRFKEDVEMGSLFQIYDLGKKISDLIHVSF